MFYITSQRFPGELLLFEWKVRVTSLKGVVKLLLNPLIYSEFLEILRVLSYCELN